MNTTEARRLADELAGNQLYGLQRRCRDEAAAMLRAQADEIERQQAERDALRGCLLWLLWHHQGASSPTGQPIRRALGIDKHAPMTEAQIEAGQRFGVGAACTTAGE